MLQLSLEVATASKPRKRMIEDEDKAMKKKAREPKVEEVEGEETFSKKVIVEEVEEEEEAAKKACQPMVEEVEDDDAMPKKDFNDMDFRTRATAYALKEYSKLLSGILIVATFN